MWLLLLLAGCNRHWTKPGVEPVQVERDFYACMKENTSYAESSSVDRNGARSSKGMKVNQGLADACMRARGYTLERVSKKGTSEPRTPIEPQSMLELEIGALAGVGFGQESANVHAYDGTSRTFGAVEQGSRSRVDFSGGGTVGVSLRVAPIFDLAVGLGGIFVPRGSDVVLAIEPQDLDNGTDYDQTRSFGSALALTAGLDARLRLPMFKQLYLLGGVRGQSLPRIPASTFDGQIELYDESRVDDEFYEQDFERETPGVDARFIPVARLGIGIDLLYASPHGFRGACFAELVPGDGRWGDAPSNGETVGFSCRAAWVVALGKKH